MKKIILTITLLFATTDAFAALCKYPKKLKISNSEFSTGTAKSPAYMVELSGMLNGNYVTLTSYNITMGKAFGFGRITSPKIIKFIPSNTKTLKCKF